MAKYRIVIPVVAQYHDFGRLLQQITKPKLLTIVNNFDSEPVQNFCNIMAEYGTKVINWPENRGCAAAWNVGLKMIEEEGLDFVIICSPSCVWNNSVEDFVKEIESAYKKDLGYIYIATGQHVTDTHAFAITRKGLQMIGYFDENFHPVYFEDADYYRRMELLGIERTYIKGLRKSKALNGGVKKDPRIWHQYIHSAERIKEYYIKKWGGMPGQEIFSEPYGNALLSVRDWTPVDRKTLQQPLSKKEYRRLKNAGII